MKDKYLSYIGLAIKAGKCKMGSYACESEILYGKPRVVICSSMASERTVKKFEGLCTKINVPFLTVDDDMAQIGGIGTYLYCVTDKNLAEAIISNAAKDNHNSN